MSILPHHCNCPNCTPWPLPKQDALEIDSLTLEAVQKLWKAWGFPEKLDDVSVGRNYPEGFLAGDP